MGNAPVLMIELEKNYNLLNITLKVPKRPVIEAVSAIFMTKLEENKNLISQTSRIPERITVESASVLYFTRLNVPSLRAYPKSPAALKVIHEHAK